MEWAARLVIYQDIGIMLIESANLVLQVRFTTPLSLAVFNAHQAKFMILSNILVLHLQGQQQAAQQPTQPLQQQTQLPTQQQQTAPQTHRHGQQLNGRVSASPVNRFTMARNAYFVTCQNTGTATTDNAKIALPVQTSTSRSDTAWPASQDKYIATAFTNALMLDDVV